MPNVSWWWWVRDWTGGVIPSCWSTLESESFAGVGTYFGTSRTLPEMCTARCTPEINLPSRERPDHIMSMLYVKGRHLGTLNERDLALPIDFGGGLLRAGCRAIDDGVDPHQRSRQRCWVIQISLQSNLVEWICDNRMIR